VVDLIAVERAVLVAEHVPEQLAQRCDVPLAVPELVEPAADRVFAPHLEEVINLLRDKAAILGKALNLDPYDALADEFSPGLRSEEIDSIFTTLGRRLPGLIQEVIEQQSTRPEHY
jgi:carboxypeptidase Taq